jgi:hemolysin activation/secretion protein
MVNLAQIVPVVIRSSFLSSVLQKTNIGAFYDYGYVRNKFVNDVSSQGYMSGAGVKLVYNGQYFKVDLTYSKGLHSPQFLQNVYHISRDNESIYCDLKLGLF